MPSAPIFLTVAPPGWGKTEFVMSNPECLLLACQQGHGGVDGYKITITSWDDKKEPEEIDGMMHMSFRQAVRQIQKNRAILPYKFVAIDTLDDLIKMLVREMLGKLHVQHLSDLEYGKGWDLGQNSPFRNEMNILTKCGMGVIFITHEDTTEKTFKGVKQAKKETALPGGIFKQIFPIVESVLHGVFGKRRKGQVRRDRIFVTEGSESMLAKNRYGLLPPAWVVNPDIEERWEEFKSFWSDPKKRDEAFKHFQELGYDIDEF